MSNVTKLSVFGDEQIPDLSFVKDAPNVVQLTAMDVASPDLGPLAQYVPHLVNLQLMTRRQIKDFTPLEALRDLRYLHLISPGIDDLEFVSRLPQLRSLDLDDVGGVSDFSPLIAQTNLTGLALSQARQFHDLNDLPPLGNMLTFTLRDSSLTCGLQPLVAQMPKLIGLSLKGSSWVNDLSSLAPLNLRILELWKCASVVDLRPIAGQVGLQYLDLEETGVSDLAPLANLSSLATLYLRDCPHVADLRPLEGLSNLRYLYIRGTHPGIDVGPLSANKKLVIYADPEVTNARYFGRRLQISDF